MARTAVFLGAGASKPFGYPLTKELFPLMLKGSPDRDEISRSLRHLFPGYVDIEEKHLPMITEVLSLIDHLIEVSQAPSPDLSHAELLRFRIQLERSMLWVLEHARDIQLKAGLTAGGPQRKFVDWFQKRSGSIGIVSTNYDVAIESELYRLHSDRLDDGFDYGFSWRNIGSGETMLRPRDPLFSILKLHGSTNWLACDLCEHVYINRMGSIAQLAYPEDTASKNDDTECHCGGFPLRSVIIAPSLVRDIRNVNLLEVWKTALEYLRSAEEWIIIGYSFPGEDLGIRSLFVRAFQAREVPPRVVVVQHGNDPKTRANYRLLFPGCEYKTGGVEGFLREIE
jgi:hypothetical protein